jgi:hypothetical protein
LSVAEFIHYLHPTLSEAGFRLDEMQDDIVFRGGSAWAVYYRGMDCKLQLCWAARDAGTYFMLAPIDAPNELGLVNSSKKWQMMLLLSKLRNPIQAPDLGAGDSEIMSWMKELFDMHYESAHRTLLSEIQAD